MSEAPRISVDLDGFDGEILNPERGFYEMIDLATPSSAAGLRDRNVTLALSLVRLDDYRDRPLSDDLLATLDRGFDEVRAAGIKVILRFAYNASFDSDAPRDQILAHLRQLEPLLRANADVIAVMQAGFIGAWGEWHSSENGLDNDADRGAILEAILAALPADRSVQVRTPMFKAAMLGDAVLDDSRVGHHNDCFLASDSDLGTYADPVDEWRGYLAADSLAVPVGGETCALNPPRTDCEGAIADLGAFHWSYLNRGYRREVLDEWDRQGCGAEIRDRLGYRLVASRISHEEYVAPGGDLRIELELENRGFAAPFNERAVYATLIGSDRRVDLRIDADPRSWHPGEPVVVDARLEIPGDLEPGTYDLALWLPDAAPRLTADSRYAIRLANLGVWDPATGTNVVSRLIVSDRRP